MAWEHGSCLPACSKGPEVQRKGAMKARASKRTACIGRNWRSSTLHVPSEGQ